MFQIPLGTIAPGSAKTLICEINFIDSSGSPTNVSGAVLAVYAIGKTSAEENASATLTQIGAITGLYLITMISAGLAEGNYVIRATAGTIGNLAVSLVGLSLATFNCTAVVVDANVVSFQGAIIEPADFIPATTVDGLPLATASVVDEILAAQPQTEVVDSVTRLTAAALASAPVSHVTILPSRVGGIAVGKPINVDWETMQYSQFTVSFPLIDSAGNPIDLSESLLSILFFFANAALPLTEFSAVTGGIVGAITVSGTDHNVITITLDAALLTAAGLYNWVLRNMSTKAALASGTLRVHPAPAR